MKPAVCVGVHAVFAPGAYDALIGAGCSPIVTTNSIVHQTNVINIAKIVGDAVSELF
jgi:ribose-phosphate pyrophosphokinase